ncbi:MAG: hypothetical protein V3S71_05270 [Acidobacteriota bacterium]
MPDQTPTPDTSTPEGVAQAQVNTLLSNPAQVPQKFKAADGTVNVDALMASYLELEKSKSAAPADSSAAPAATPAAASGSSAADALAASSTPTAAESLADALSEPKAPEAGEMWTAINAEFASTGTISDESAKLLIASGADPAILVTFNAGLAAKQKADMATAADMVGGKESLDTTLAWAKENLSADEKAAIIPQLNGAQAETILMGLHARRLAATAPSGQVDTNALAGGTLPQGNPDLNLKPFRDWNEQQAAMSDPRYATDPDYRAVCETRLQLGAGYEIDRR